ncbi:MAG: LPS-assembly protein LptD [Geobacter sp.]
MKQIMALLLMFLLLVPAALSAAEIPGTEGMVIKADRMDHDVAGDLLTASGKVEMTWQGMTMTADQAVFNRQERILVATGNVIMVKAGDTLSGDRLIMDTETGRSEMENGHIFMSQGNFRADGAQIARLGDDQYALHQGEFTTCDAEVPSWKFGATDFDVTVEEYAAGSNVVFYVKNVPVFYFPYLILPVKRERQSGFLFPGFGSSTKRGTFIEIPFYWAISPSQEATFNLDLQTKRGVGLGTDYRNLRSRTSTGSAGGYIIYDNNEDKVRGQLVQYHREQLPDNLSLVTSINLTSDETYLRDYADKNGDYNRQYYDSRVVATKSWDHWLTAAQAIYTQDFATGSNAATLQRLPELLVYGVRQPLPYLPLQLDLDLIATNYYRENGMQGQRAVLTPQLISNQAFFNGRLNSRVSAGAQLRAYNVEDAPTTTEDQSVVAVPELNAELASSFSRTLDGNLLGFKLLRHELAPTVAYRYVVDRDQQQYPLFDQNDRFLHQNLVYLSLASHLGGKLEDDNGGAHYRHLQTLRLKQGYSFSGDRPDLLTLAIDDQRPWSNLTLESETWLHRSFRLLADAGYNHYDNRFTSTALGGDYNDGRGNSIGASYRWTDQQVEYLEGRVTTTLLRPVYLSYIQRYSFDRKDFLEQELDIEYRHQCWSVFASYQERLGNRSFTINFNLAGLFTSGGSKTSALGRGASAP